MNTPLKLLQNTTFSVVKPCQLLTKTHVLASILLRNIKVKKSVTSKIGMTCLASLLAHCSPSYAIASHNQLSTIHSFNCVDMVAVSVNNGRQEFRTLLTTVQRRTIADVFLCLSFASLPFMGELRLFLAMTSLWWGGIGNKSFIGRIPITVLLRVRTSLPPYLGQHQNIITIRTGITT